MTEGNLHLETSQPTRVRQNRKQTVSNDNCELGSLNITNSYENHYPPCSSPDYSTIELPRSNMARTRSQGKKVSFKNPSVPMQQFLQRALRAVQRHLIAQSELDYAHHHAKQVRYWVQNIRDGYERDHPVDDDDSSTELDDTLMPPKEEKKAPKDTYRIGKFRHYSRVQVKLFFKKRMVAVFKNVPVSKWVKISPQN